MPMIGAKYAVIFEKTNSGYSAYVPDLPGCVAAGATVEETEELMRGAIEMHLEGMREDGEIIPPPTTVARYLEIPAQPAA
jgi:predicted RNase H-like HicB family nuclease